MSKNNVYDDFATLFQFTNLIVSQLKNEKKVPTWNVYFTRYPLSFVVFISQLSAVVKLVLFASQPTFKNWKEMFSKDKTMYGNAKFKTVPIIDVTKENVSSVGAVVRGAIIGADFIAIDCVRTADFFGFLKPFLRTMSRQKMHFKIVKVRWFVK